MERGRKLAYNFRYHPPRPFVIPSEEGGPGLLFLDSSFRRNDIGGRAEMTT